MRAVAKGLCVRFFTHAEPGFAGFFSGEFDRREFFFTLGNCLVHFAVRAIAEWLRL